jgi:uncharacterized protein
MLRHGDGVLYSASDLVNFMGCAHATYLDVGNLGTSVTFAPDDETAVLLQEKGIEHERAYLGALVAQGLTVADIPADLPLGERAELTRAAMREGVDVIYQGAFIAEPWHGYSDFLLRTNGVQSQLGDYAYEVVDTKLSRSAKPKHLLQLCVYAELLAREQGALPRQMHVVLGDGTTATFRVSAVIHYFHAACERFRAYASTPPPTSAGEPCGHCKFCRWATRCGDEWEADGHLSIVANMSRS